MAMRQEEADAVEAAAEKERDAEEAQVREERRQAQIEDDDAEPAGTPPASSPAR